MFKCQCTQTKEEGKCQGLAIHLKSIGIFISTSHSIPLTLKGTLKTLSCSLFSKLKAENLHNR